MVAHLHKFGNRSSGFWFRVVCRRFVDLTTTTGTGR